MFQGVTAKQCCPGQGSAFRKRKSSSQLCPTSALRRDSQAAKRMLTGQLSFRPGASAHTPPLQRDLRHTDYRHHRPQRSLIFEAVERPLPCLAVPCPCDHCQHVIPLYLRGTLGVPHCAPVLCPPLFQPTVSCASCAHWDASGRGSFLLHNVVSQLTLTTCQTRY
jgi:hypothetical protein